jgi:glycosyltransferase involved in cell wall biosynthesis
MRILYVEPFEGGSHAAFSRALMGALDAHWTALTLPGRHWKWRMRGSAAYFAQAHAETLAQPYDLVVASSYVPLAELVGLAPALATVPRILYFHENQLAFPSLGPAQPRDNHFGFTQLVSALAAQRCVFNSAYNRDSFLDAAADLLRRMPDAVPKGWVEAIRGRSTVLGVPMPLTDDPVAPAVEHADGPLLLWNHRWEHDKNPQTCLRGLVELADEGVAFRVAVAGKRFTRAPAVFEEFEPLLRSRAVHWGHADAATYRRLLDAADVVLSTAHHEFFGVAVMEAVHHGARPLVPDRLAYRELWPDAFRYRDDAAFVPALRELLTSGAELRADRRQLTKPFAVETLVPRFAELFSALVRG